MDVRYAGVVPSATFQTKDGRYVIIGGNGDSIYTRLMTAVGRSDMGADNPLFKSNTDRCKHEKEIYAVSNITPASLLIHVTILTLMGISCLPQTTHA